jgi:hypothetical protein
MLLPFAADVLAPCGKHGLCIWAAFANSSRPVAVATGKHSVVRLSTAHGMQWLEILGPRIAWSAHMGAAGCAHSTEG